MREEPRSVFELKINRWTAIGALVVFSGPFVYGTFAALNRPPMALFSAFILLIQAVWYRYARRRDAALVRVYEDRVETVSAVSTATFAPGKGDTITQDSRFRGYNARSLVRLENAEAEITLMLHCYGDALKTELMRLWPEEAKWIRYL